MFRVSPGPAAPPIRRNGPLDPVQRSGLLPERASGIEARNRARTEPVAGPDLLRRGACFLMIEAGEHRGGEIPVPRGHGQPVDRRSVESPARCRGAARAGFIMSRASLRSKGAGAVADERLDGEGIRRFT